MVMTTHPAIVREATLDDLDRVASVLRAANAEFEPALARAFFRAYLTNVLDVRSRLSESRLFVAEQAGKGVVGAITLYLDASKEGWGWPPDWAGIRAVAVEPSARGLRIGKCLAAACIEHARAYGAPTIGLHTATFMAEAVRMYESLGFRRAPEFDRDAGEMVKSAPIEPPIVALAYRLDLKTGGDS